MKKLFLSLFLIPILYACGQSNSVNTDMIAPKCESVKGLELEDESKSPPSDYTGPFKVCNNETGKVFFKGEVIEGKIHGESLIYNRHGQLMVRSHYQNGKLNGTVTKYHDNGQIKWEETYLKDTQKGERKEYNKDGELIK